MLCGDLRKTFISELLAHKEFAHFADHRIVHGKRNLLYRRLYKFLFALGQLTEMLVRAEEFLISRFRHINQRVQNILLALEMIVQRRRLDSDLLGDLFHTCSVVAILGKQRQNFIQYSISCCHMILQSKRLIIISFIITNDY